MLLSDGASKTGADPAEVAQKARAANVPIYTVALGTADGVVEAGGQVLSVPPDPEALQQVAELSGGKAFTAEDADALDEVYETLGSRIGTQEGEARGQRRLRRVRPADARRRRLHHAALARSPALAGRPARPAGELSAICSRMSRPSWAPASMPVPMMMSRTSCEPHSESIVSTVRSPSAANVLVTTMPGPGAPSKTSVLTIRSPSTIS